MIRGRKIKWYGSSSSSLSGFDSWPISLMSWSSKIGFESKSGSKSWSGSWSGCNVWFWSASGSDFYRKYKGWLSDKSKELGKLFKQRGLL